MQSEQIHSYLREFFKENDCPILSAHEHYHIVQLTVDMDKKIMNRPFYWQYIESTGGESNPAQLTLITNKNKVDPHIRGEVIHFGSPRLTQLFHVTKEQGSFVRMYEHTARKQQTILTPWLVVNYKISYESHRVKEEIYSLGMNLMTGEVLKEFQEEVFKKELSPTPPTNTFNLPYTIQPMTAIERLENIIEQYILQQEHNWADEAREKLAKEELVLDYFYEGIEMKTDLYRMEKEALATLYEPVIRIDVVNGGLFYLQ